MSTSHSHHEDQPGVATDTQAMTNASPSESIHQPDEIEQLRQEVVILKQHLQQQQAQIAALAQALGAPAEQSSLSADHSLLSVPHADEQPAGFGVRAPTSRRNLLKWGGLGAAAALAAAGTASVTGLGQAPIAHAADGDNIVLGTTNYSSTETVVSFGDSDPTNPNIDHIGLTVYNGSLYDDYYVAQLKVGLRGSSDAYGVAGSGGSAGVIGYSNNQGAGIGSSGLNAAVMGVSTLTQGSSVDFYANGSGIILQTSWGGVGNPGGALDDDFYQMGAMVRDNNGDMYICIAPASDTLGWVPSSWKKVCALDTGFLGGGTGLLPTPQRIYDTRKSGGPFKGSVARTIQVTGQQIPGDAVGCIGNLTVTNATAGGYLVIYPAGSPKPITSTVNFLAGQTVANSFVVGLGSGKVTIHSFTSGQCNVILDITGFVG